MSYIANSVSENGIVITPKAFKIESCIFSVNNGEKINLLPTIHNIEIHEGMTRTGLHVRIFIEDAANLMDELKIAFNEKIKLVINRPEHSGEKGFELNLILWGMNNYSEPTPSSKGYILECITKHGYLSPLKLIDRPFDNTAAKLIKNIIETDLDSKVDVRCTTNGVVKGIYPNVRPLYAISWLLRNATDNGTPVYLFETAEKGLILTSYNEILKQKPFLKYNKNPYFQNTLHASTEEGIYEEERSRIIKIISQENAGKFESAEKGVFGSVMNKIDISTKKVKPIKRFEYKDIEGEKLNGESIVNEFMKIGKNFITDFKNYRNHYVSENSLAFDNDGSGKGKKNYHDTIGDKDLLKRNAHLHSLNTTALTIMLAGDFEFSPGKIIDLEIIRQADVSEELDEGKDFLDNQLSGKYLVSSVIHKFTKSGYFIETNIKKDSFVAKQVREKV